MAGRHRLDPPPRVRLRWGRALVAGVAGAVTAVAVLGGLGLLHVPSPSGPVLAGASGPDTAGQAAGQRASGSDSASRADFDRTDATPGPNAHARDPKALPADSGHGKRIVFDISRQRVWLVQRDGGVESTYLVSGSLTDNLHPGHYQVYSRSRWAVGIDDSGVMQYFVRFTRGKNAAIGFHSIPTKNGHPLQTRAQLGHPESHGCIRQWLPDAIRLWNFAPLGTQVVVTA